MGWDADWKLLAQLCYICMNDGIGFYIWGLIREVWEGEVHFTAIALAFCEVEICRPPREYSFATFFCVFIQFYVISSASFDFLTCIINPLYTDNTRRCPILSSEICCQYNFTSAVFFYCVCSHKMTTKRKNNAEIKVLVLKEGICVQNVWHFKLLWGMWLFLTFTLSSISFLLVPFICHWFLYTKRVPSLITKVKEWLLRSFSVRRK